MSVETLGLPAEMVAESVVDSIQTNNFDAVEDGSSSLTQVILALSIGIILCFRDDYQATCSRENSSVGPAVRIVNYFQHYGSCDL